MPSVKVRVGEPVEKALKRLKKILDREGILRAFRTHRYYDKPSVKKRAKQKQALRYRR